MSIDRRLFLTGLALMAGGCVSTRFDGRPQAAAVRTPAIDPSYLAMYGPIDDEPFPIPAVDLSRVDPKFLRRYVDYDSPYTPGTIVVDPNTRYLYLTMGGGKALRYGVGVGKEEAFNLTGEAVIARKASWPGWRPTQSMIAREPDRYGPLADGLPGGLTNPLGARALYLYRDGRDTLYRIHGTLEPWTIGTMVSSGCIRLMNQDIIDLHRRVPNGTRVVIMPATGAFV